MKPRPNIILHREKLKTTPLKTGMYTLPTPFQYCSGSTSYNNKGRED